MTRPALWLVVALAACGYDKPALTGGGDDGPGDARGSGSGIDADPSDAKDLLTFGFPGANPALANIDYDGAIDQGAATVTVDLFHVDPTTVISLVPRFTTSGASVSVNGDDQTTGVDAQDFSHAVTYVVTARNGSTKAYTVGLQFRDFQPVTELGISTADLAVADLDGDGKSDLVAIGTTADDEVLVSTTTAGGLAATFTTVSLVGPGAIGSDSCAIGDFDGSHRPQIAHEGGTPSGVVPVTSAAHAPLAFGTDAAFTSAGSRLQAADIDGDGKPDLVDLTGEGIEVMVNTTVAAGPPTFSGGVPFLACSTANMYNVVVADFNRDGKPDIAVTCESDALVAVLINTTLHAGSPTFADAQHLPCGVLPTVGAADLDGDGLPEIVTANSSGGNSTISVLRNTTQSADAVTFAPAQTFPTASSAYGVAFADVDGDGYPDVLTSGGSLGVVLNRTPAGGMLAFAVPIAFAAKGEFWIQVGDFNHDGLPDIATAKPLTSVLLGK